MGEVPQEGVDALIVGAGAAGGLLAAKLAGAGKSVMILEAGPPRSLGDLISSPLWSRRLRWGGAHIQTEGSGPVAVGFNAGWGTGGAALHHYATWPRLKVEDFKVRSQYGRGLDWPIDYHALRPFYDRVQEEVGMAGDAEAEIWRPPASAYPMPPLKISQQARAIARGFAALGKQVAPTPMAINSTVYRGRAACMYDGWCDAGCPIGALANPQVTYLAAAMEKGATLINDAGARRLIATRPGRVDAVEYRAPSGAIIVQPARQIILAASVIGNPALLLNSVSALHPQGMGNRHDLVGRYLMTHSMVSIVGIFPQDTEPHVGVSGANMMSHHDYAKAAAKDFFGSRQWLIAPSLKPGDFARLAPGDLYGARLEEFIQRAVRRGGGMSGMAEEMPEAGNRIELNSAAVLDGIQAAKAVHAYSPEVTALARKMSEEGIAVFEAAGARQLSATGVNSAHLMGGTVMGEDTSTSVTDSFGRIHELSNLWVAGPGLFPTSGAVNPTFTAQALALRTAEHLIDHWAALSA